MVKVIVTVVAVIILGAAGFAVFHSNSPSYKASSTTDKTSAQTNSAAPTQSSGESQVKTQTQNSTDGNTSSPTSNQPSSSATAKVTINNFAFNQANLTVKKGTTVTWTNQDSTAHTVTETDGQNGPNSQDLNQGQSYSFTFTKTGTFEYDCSIHPYMKATVTVTD